MFLSPYLRERTFGVGGWEVRQELAADLFSAEGRADLSGGEWELTEQVRGPEGIREERRLVCSASAEAIREADWWAAAHRRLLGGEEIAADERTFSI